MPGRLASDVGAVILHFRNVEDTEACLASLFEGDEVPRRVVVVNNDATPELSRELASRFDIEVVTPATNLGYGPGMNVGLAQLLADPSIEYAWCVNNDLVVARDCLARLRATLGSDARTGGVCPHVALPDGSTMSRGAVALPPLALWLPWRRRHSGETGCLDGSSMLFRTRWLRRVGVFDEAFFANVEDVDLSLRLRRAGARLACVDDARVVHKLSQSKGGQFGTFNVYLSSRNWVYLARKSARTKASGLVAACFTAGARTLLVWSWALRARRAAILVAHARGVRDGLFADRASLPRLSREWLSGKA